MPQLMQPLQDVPDRPFRPVRITFCYFAFGLLWMLSSYFVEHHFSSGKDPHFLGLLVFRLSFALLSSFLLYALIYRLKTLPDIGKWQITPRNLSFVHFLFWIFWIVFIRLFTYFALDDLVLRGVFIYISGLILIGCTTFTLFLFLSSVQNWLDRNRQTFTRFTLQSGVYRTVLIILFLTLLIPFISFTILELLSPQVENNAFSELKMSAQIRALQLEGWLGEREYSTFLTLTSSSFIENVRKLEKNGDLVARTAILGQFESLKTAQQYRTLILFDTQRRPVVSIGPPMINPAEAQRQIKNAVQKSYEELYSKDTNRTDFIVPLYMKNTHKPLGWVFVILDQKKYLSSYLDHWSETTSDKQILLVEQKSKDTMLFRKDPGESGNSVIKVFRATNNGLSRAILAGGKKPGTLKGNTLYDETALAAWYPVKGTDWFAVIKIDQRNLMAPVRNLAFWFNLAFISILMIFGVILLFIWHVLQRSQILAADLREKQLLNNFYTLPFIGMGVLSVTLDKWIHFNDTLCDIFGYSREEFSKKGWLELCGQPCMEEHPILKALGRGDSTEFTEEKTFCRKNGETAIAEVHFRCVVASGGTSDYLVVTVEDITERKVAQSQIYRLSQLYATLSHCNQAIVHSRTEKELFEQICYGIVNYSAGRFKVAWIGLIDEQSGKVDMTVSHGIPDELIGSIQTMRIVTEFDSMKNNSPAAVALRENRALWIQDVHRTSLMTPWNELLEKMAVRSLAVFPLYQAGKPIGVLKVYSSEPDAYDDQSKNLLNEMANDLNFALDNFEREAVRKRTAKELEESERNYRQLYTERMQAEDEIRRLNQLYAALSQCNQSIIRCKNQQELFAQICHDIVEYGQMDFTWVGLLNRKTLDIVPVASAGDHQEYLKDLYINALPDHPAGQGPAGEVIRENRPVWMQDFINEPAMKNWRTHIRQFSWRSSAILPLHRNGHVIGAVFLYANVLNAFTDSSQRLLQELMEDIDFALEHFEKEEQLQLSAQIFAQSSEGIMLLDAGCNIVMINRAFTHITGYTENEVLGRNPKMLSSGQHDRNFYTTMWEAIEREGRWQGEIWNRRKNGAIYPEWLLIQTMRDAKNNLTHYIGTFTDLTERKETEEQVKWLAHFDPLTGLPNRTLLHIRSNLAISLAQRRHELLALMFLDLDNFKNVNDSLGHGIGDELLKQFADRLSTSVREQDTISRLGGDEFVLILPGTDTDGAAYLAERLLGIAARQYNIERHEINLTVSIGIAMYPTDGTDFDTLWRSADAAMYRAKQTGRNDYCFFTTEMQARSARTLQIDNALRRALERHQFSLVYQPQLSLDTNRIVGFEALIRWKHPQFGNIPPDEFIPIAESNGQIIPIGEWVLKTAVRQLRTWRDNGLYDFTISVNLSAVQFRHHRLPELVMNILDEAGVPPECLQLELTEGVAMENPIAAITVIEELRKKGINISIDDFGTGYSSLTYLKRFDLYSLKIDRSFVQDIPADTEDMAIVSAVISLAGSLDMRTVAEGVESREQLEFLRSRGCTEIQGYYLSRPLAADDVAAFLGNGYMKTKT